MALAPDAGQQAGGHLLCRCMHVSYIDKSMYVKRLVSFNLVSERYSLISYIDVKFSTTIKGAEPLV